MNSSTSTSPSVSPATRGAALGALGADAALVLVFVVIGRATHENPLLGALVTLWPFLTGLGIGWVAARGWRAPRAIGRTGVPVWLSTVVIGMLLRVASDQGVQPSFVIVATLVLGAFLLGWRALARALTRSARAD